ncbi:hypothetical protein A4A49_14194 [Nicotiana attenuata]|uniref:Uncharacterized protein n=1 Tax=Nicotiana attenuata TaxID=49451 RepID=A0A314KL25_NICAT|nr:hypothetical protein A4A49_14194 [Nicotiana attenuata]
MLTKRLLHCGVPVYEEADEIVPAPTELLDILVIPLENGPKLSAATRQEQDNNLQCHMYYTMSPLLQNVGVTEAEKQKVNLECPLLGSTKKLLGLSPCNSFHSSEDRNTTLPSPSRGEAGEEVDDPLAIVSAVADDTVGGLRSRGSRQVRRLVDEESDEEGSEYDQNRISFSSLMQMSPVGMVLFQLLSLGK